MADAKGKLTKEERARLREQTAEAVAGVPAEEAERAAARLVPLLVPDPKAEVGRGGLRVSREIVLEVTETLQKKIRSPVKMRGVATGLWKSGADEARVVSALLHGSFLPTSDDEKEAGSVSTVRRLVLETVSPVVLDAIGEMLSREMEKGATDSWDRAFQAWRKEEDRRLRQIGLSAFTHLLSRGKTPEKLFDGLMQARRLIADPDPEIRNSVVGLFHSGAKKQPKAVLRFLARFDEDEREEARDLAAKAREKIGEPEPEKGFIDDESARVPPA